MPGSVLFSALDEARTRYPETVAELTTFFAGYGVPVGSPEAVAVVAARAEAEGPFREDLLSMLRVLEATEPGITYLELLGTLVLGAAGAEAAAAPAEGEDEARSLLNFVMDSRRIVPAHEPEDSSGEWTGAAAPENAVEAPSAVERVEVAAAPPVAVAVAAGERGPSVLARALALSADGESFGAGRMAGRAAEQEGSEAESGALPVEAAPDDAELTETPGQRPLWLAALAGVAVGLVLGLLLGLWAPWRLPLRPETPAAVGATADEVNSGAAHVAAGQPRSARGTGAVRREGELAEREGVPGARAGVEESSHVVPRSTAAGERPSPEAPAPVVRNPAAGVAVLPRAQPRAVREVHLGAPAEAVAGRGSRLGTPRVVVGSAGIMAGNLLSSPAPAYPVQASMAQVQGEVVIEAVVGRDGSVVEARVVSGPAPLQAAALAAVQRWRYRPYEVDGKAAEIATTAHIDFRLNADGGAGR